jgi:hypothetical protein
LNAGGYYKKRPCAKEKLQIGSGNLRRIHNWVITNQPNMQPARRGKRDEGDGKKREARD